MAKRRYHYDSKGKLKGSSSNTYLATASDYKFLGLLALGAIAFTTVFGTGNDKQKVNNNSAKSELATTQEGSDRMPVISTAVSSDEGVEARQIGQNASPVDDLDLSGNVTPSTTHEYLERTYVNGNTSCPRDIIEYYEKQCEAGDQQACTRAACE